MKRNPIIIAMLLMLCSSVAGATCSPLQTAATAKGFFISGILEKSDRGVKVKLVHLIEVATSEEEALERFVHKVANDYPNYRIADTIVSIAGGSGEQSCDQEDADRNMI